MRTLIIDNVGFDVEALAKLSEKEFVDTHLSNDAIAANKSNTERIKYLKNCYKEVKKSVSSFEKPKDSIQ